MKFLKHISEPQLKSLVQRHMDKLSKILGVTITEDKMLALAEIELEGHRFAEKCCNGELTDDEYCKLLGQAASRAYELLTNGEYNSAVMFNGDPRGHFLKLEYKFLIEKESKLTTDWGGYGIIVPDFVQKYFDLVYPAEEL